MDSLPGHLLDMVLFKTDLRALAMLCCTNTSLQSHIQNPSFVSEYYSQIKSSLLHISAYGSRYLVYHQPHHGSWSLKTKNILTACHILQGCSGLLLLFIDDRLCVTNPVLKKFRFLTLTNHMCYRCPKRKQLGLAVNQIDPTIRSFKVVYIFEMENYYETKYGFEINAGDSWKRSKATLTCQTSNLDYRMKSPVYLDGSLHWLRNDGSIVAFNPETEKARLIQIEFPHGLSSKTLFASGDNSLTLVSANEEVIYVYALESFKVVFIFEVAKTDVTRYGFEINDGNSWRCSKTTLTCRSSNLDNRMKKPVYLDGSLHWLRKDGSIIAFNLETEQARLIQIDFPQGLTSRTLFAPGVNSLTLVSLKEEVIYVYALKNILSDPKWVLVKQIQNGLIDKNRVDWYVEAYNEKCLVLQCFYNGGVVHVYDLIDNKWVVMGSVPAWCDANRDFFLFTPSSSSVVGLDEILACGDRSISSLRLIMGLVDGSSTEKVEKQIADGSSSEEVRLHLGMLVV